MQLYGDVPVASPDPEERPAPQQPGETLHTVRFRRAKMEFDLTSSADAVADALVMLAPMVAAAFDGARKSRVPSSRHRGKSRKGK